MSMIDDFVTDLSATFRSDLCDDPMHVGCRKCDEDALTLKEREEYEDYDDGPD